MSSEAFKKFEMQFKATGSEKADGYVSTWFQEMSGPEQDKALNLLIKELEHSSHPMTAIASIGNSRAIDALVKKWESYPHDIKKLQFTLATLLTQLTQLTQDPTYTEQLDISISELDRIFHIPLANSLKNVVSEKSNEILRSIISQSEFRAARGTAAKILLSRRFANMDEQIKLSYLQDLKDDDKQARLDSAVRIFGN